MEPAPANANTGANNTARKRSYIIDWVLVVVCAVLAGALYSRPPAGSSRLLFRAGPTEQNQFINTDSYFAYPDRGEIIPTWYVSFFHPAKISQIL